MKMTTEKELQLKETYNYYWKSALENNFSLDKIGDYYAKNFMGFGTPIDEIMLSADDVLKVIIRQREQSVGIEMSYVIKPVFHNRVANDDIAIFVDEVIISMNIGGNKHEIFLRNTLVLEYLDSKWKIVHFHASVPVRTESETDTWGIDEWKKRSEELQKLVDERTRELQTSLETLKSTQAQLIQSEKLASLGELTAGIAHEIQNPLNFVNNFSEVSTELVSELEDEQQKPERDPALEAEILGDLKQNLQKITLHGGRASAIVKGMLEHSRTSTGEKQLTNLNALADEYLRLAYHGLRAKDSRFNCELVTDLDLGLPQINIIAQDMGRVLLNLINNAFYAVGKKASNQPEGYQPTVTVSTRFAPQPPEGGVLRVGTAPPSGGWGAIIIIKDNGIGMPESVREKVFQPFFTTKPTGEGTGLGLSLAYDIVTKGHRGSLEVVSTEGVGSEFIIQIPI